MGIDMYYQAVPAEEDWWERINDQEECRREISLLPLLFLELRGGRGLQGESPVWNGCVGQEAQQLMRLRPGIERRNIRLDRWWDRLHYVLSEPRRALRWRRRNRNEDDIGSIAVRGQRLLGDDVLGGQGIPVYYNTPETVLDVAAFLEKVTEASLRAHYAPSRMYEARVYKVSADDGETEFQYLFGYFKALRSLYIEATNHCEGVLVCAD